MARKLTVHRKGYHRRGYRRKDGTYVTSSYVGPSTFKIKDRGRKGRGAKRIKVQKGAMTRLAKKFGYIKGEQTIKDIPYDRIDDFARDAARQVGKMRALGMFRAQITFRKWLRDDPFKNKMQRAFDSIRGIPLR